MIPTSTRMIIINTTQTVTVAISASCLVPLLSLFMGTFSGVPLKVNLVVVSILGLEGGNSVCKYSWEKVGVFVFVVSIRGVFMMLMLAVE